MKKNKQGDLLYAVCSQQKVGALATCDGKAAHSSLVFFAAEKKTEKLVFATLRTTRKYTNLRKYPDVSMLIDSRTDYPDNISASTAITVNGKADEVTGEELEECRKLLLAKHPALADFLDHEDCAVIVVRDVTVFTVDTFGNA